MPDNEFDVTKPTCRHCRQVIATNASICHHCHGRQNRFWHRFRDLAIIIPVAMIIIASFQLWEASKERIEASHALKQADDAVKRVEIAERNVIRLNEQLQEQFLLVVSLTWFQHQTRGAFGTPRFKKAKQEMEKDINAMLVKVMPDEAKRNQWLENLKKRLPPQ